MAAIFHPDGLPRFHPMTTLRRWADGTEFKIVHALSGGVIFMGPTGSGKTSSSKNLAIGYMAAGFGMVFLCSKASDAQQYYEWARESRREKDVRVIDAAGTWCYNFLAAESARRDAGGALTLTLVGLLDELAQAAKGQAGHTTSGEGRFWEDGQRAVLTYLIDLSLLAGLGASIPVIRSLLLSAPQTLEEAQSDDWKVQSDCYKAIVRADKLTADGDADARADFEECRNYWLLDFPTIADRTRSGFVTGCNLLFRSFLMRPLRRLFSSTTNIRPEQILDDGLIVIVSLDVQTYGLVGRYANILWKVLFQKAALRRAQKNDGSYLRPACCWADEFQYHVTSNDFMFVSVCRSAAACMAVMVQSRDSLLSVLGNEATTDALADNFSVKFFTGLSGSSAAWASQLIGERWVRVQGISANGPTGFDQAGGSTGVNFHEELRRHVDTGDFAQLRRGGELNNFLVDVIVHGPLFGDEPYRIITFNQRA